MRAAFFSPAVIELRQAKRLLGGAIGVAFVLGLVRAGSIDGFISYILITAAAILPAALWLRARVPGIPILPAIAAFHYLYFAVPILRQNLGGDYSPGETLRAGATVALFLIAASVVWGLILGRAGPGRPLQSVREGWGGGGKGRLVMFGGLALGAIFQFTLFSGWLEGIGTYFGLIRAVSLTAASIGCYLLGHFRARGLLRGQLWGLAVAGCALIVLLSWSTLYLVAGMQFVLAAGLGYVITAKRIPWGAALAIMAVLFVLHAGKGEMRDRYWAEDNGQTPSPMEMPGRLAEWAGVGLTNIATGDMEGDIIDRASLLYLLLRVEKLTPDYIPYLGGETYALLPQYLVPRFLNADKAFSQAGLQLLNVRYGFQTREDVASTTLAWGIVSEAFANFGYPGVVGAAFVLGTLTAFFTWWSTGQPPLSLPTLLSVAALVSLTNLEADFGFLLTNLWQALAATLIFFVPLKLLTGGGEARANSPSLSTP